jgi:hypothetical protein
VSGLRDRFVTAPGDAGRAASAPSASPVRSDAPPPALGVVAAPGLAAPAGAAVALAAARVARAQAALACVWAPAQAQALPGSRSPALPAARRLAAALAARGHETLAAGRLALVRLAGDEPAAAAEAVRALAAAGPAAAVLAVGGRSEALDAVLAGQDALLLWPPADAPEALAPLALASLRALGPPAAAVPARLGARARALALAGVTAPPGAADAVREALR